MGMVNTHMNRMIVWCDISHGQIGDYSEDIQTDKPIELVSNPGSYGSLV
jgi:hypothetical protein